MLALWLLTFLIAIGFIRHIINPLFEKLNYGECFISKPWRWETPSSGPGHLKVSESTDDPSDLSNVAANTDVDTSGDVNHCVPTLAGNGRNRTTALCPIVPQPQVRPKHQSWKSLSRASDVDASQRLPSWDSSAGDSPEAAPRPAHQVSVLLRNNGRCPTCPPRCIDHMLVSNPSMVAWNGLPGSSFQGSQAKAFIDTWDPSAGDPRNWSKTACVGLILGPSPSGQIPKQTSQHCIVYCEGKWALWLRLFHSTFYLRTFSWVYQDLIQRSSAGQAVCFAHWVQKRNGSRYNS